MLSLICALTIDSLNQPDYFPMLVFTGFFDTIMVCAICISIEQYLSKVKNN